MYFNKSRAQQWMNDCGVDALIATSPVNVTYFTDYTCWADPLFKEYMMSPGASDHLGVMYAGCSVSGRSCLVLDSIMAVNAADLWVDDLCTFGSASFDLSADAGSRFEADQRLYETLQVSVGKESATDALVAWLKANGLTGGCIGIEMTNLRPEAGEELRRQLPDTQFKECTNLLRIIRMVKSEEEIALIKDAARIADIGGAACVEAIGEGVPEHEVALHATSAMVREIADTHPESEVRDTWTWFQSGINTDGAHNPVSTRKIQKGDILSINCFPMIGGYYTALERTLFFDHASERHLEIWEANVEVHRRGLELIKPGVLCCDIAGELNEIFVKHDLLQYRTFGYGHSFGTLSHYYGREAGLELREDIETVLEPNMVVSIEPMVMLPDSMPGAGGYREHDILVVTKDGAENITKFPFGPEHNIIS